MTENAPAKASSVFSESFLSSTSSLGCSTFGNGTRSLFGTWIDSSATGKGTFSTASVDFSTSRICVLCGSSPGLGSGSGILTDSGFSS